MRTTADLMLDIGLAKAGYNYLVVDGEPLESLPTSKKQELSLECCETRLQWPCPTACPAGPEHATHRAWAGSGN